MKTRMFLVAAMVLVFACAGFGQGFSVFFYNDSYQMRGSDVTGCDAGAPIPDGTPIYIYQDADNDGPDADDQLAPLCENPPDCPTGPPGTHNMNTMAFNGELMGVGAGYFYAERNFLSIGVIPVNNRYYLRVNCENGDPHYLSPVYTFSSSAPLDVSISQWTCLSCNIPEPCTPEIVTFYGGRESVPQYDCAQVCAQLPTILRVCPAPGTGPLLADKPPIVSVFPGCDPVNTNCDSICPPAVEFIYNPDPLSWIYDPLTGCFSSVIIGLSEGCVCISLEGFLAVGFNNDFAAQPLDGAMKLSWSTNSEVGLARYEVLRNAEKIGEVAAANAAHEYNYVDETAVNGTTYTYTLRVVNADATMSELATVQGTPSFGAAVITEYALHQNFPNPFNPSTSLTFDVVDKNFVSLKVFNAAGQEVGTVANSEYEAGRHTVNFSAANLPSGLYFYTVKIGNEFSATKKMLLVK